MTEAAYGLEQVIASKLLAFVLFSCIKLASSGALRTPLKLAI